MKKDKTILAFFKRKREDHEAEDYVSPSNLISAAEVSSNETTTASIASVPIEATIEIENQGQTSQRIELTFRGIEFLERDPALRPQIWKYPVAQREEVRRAYLTKGPMQPHLQEYKASGKKGHLRRFQYNWFSHFPDWLEYSVSNHRAYCFVCFLFSDNSERRSGYDVFTVHGFENWKKVKDGKKCAFHKHQSADPCSQHKNALRSCMELLNKSGHLKNIYKSHSAQAKEDSRLRLKVSIAAVRWLTFQFHALRGHDETTQSRNRGNFIELIKLLAEFNPEIEKVVLDRAPYNSKYTSPEIQKEILSICANLIRKRIRKEIGNSNFTIIVDETCDAAKREQMALVLRFVDEKGVLQERFFDLIHVKNTKSVTLRDELYSILRNHSLDIQKIRGQGYDGSSNMKGELNGLQALILKDCPYAYFVHCYAHRLQLALVAASKEVIHVHQFFQKLAFIINTVDSSAKRHDELRDSQMEEIAHLLAIDELETGKGANQTCSLQRAGDTRWGSHLGSIANLKKMFNAVSTVLQKIIVDGSSSSLRADGDTALGYLLYFDFVFILCLMEKVLAIAEVLSKAMQMKTQDIVNAANHVTTTTILLQKMRDDGWKEFLTKVVQFCDAHGVQVPNMNDTYILRGGRARHQHDSFSNEHFYRVEVYLVTIDTQLQELKYKFSEKFMEIFPLMAALIPKNEFKGFDAENICGLVEKYYPQDFTQQERYMLEDELSHFVIDFSMNKELKKIGTLTELCQCLAETDKNVSYGLVDRLVRLLAILPISTATAERAFSVLKIIKTRLRTKMEDDYLADSMLVNIEDEIAESVSYDEIIEDFRNLKDRRADLAP